jgi:L-fucose mutarotase
VLKGLDPYLTPELLYHLAEMGHGDVFALVDRNFPARNDTIIELPHANNDDALRAILSVYPVDHFPGSPVVHMLTDDGEEGPALSSARAVLNEIEGREVEVQGILRHGPDGFYARCEKVRLMVRTSETRPYACLLIPKGVI